MTDQPMTKTEARAFLKRAREGLRDAEAALKAGSADDLHEALNEVGGAAAHVQNGIDGPYGYGIRGVVWTEQR